MNTNTKIFNKTLAFRRNRKEMKEKWDMCEKNKIHYVHALNTYTKK